MILKIKSGLIYTLGIILLIIGIVGLFLPILQGLLIIALGLYVLSLRSEKARRLLDKILKRFPLIHTAKIAFLNWFHNLKKKFGF